MRTTDPRVRGSEVSAANAAAAQSTDTIHFYRSDVSIVPGDTGIEHVELLCGSSVVCNASSTSNIVLGENLAWQTETVVPVTLMAWTVD